MNASLFSFFLQYLGFGLLSLCLGVSRGASLGDFLLAPVYPIEKIPLWDPKPTRGVSKNKVFA